MERNDLDVSRCHGPLTLQVLVIPLRQISLAFSEAPPLSPQLGLSESYRADRLGKTLESTSKEDAKEF